MFTIKDIYSFNRIQDAGFDLRLVIGSSPSTQQAQGNFAYYVSPNSLLPM